VSSWPWYLQGELPYSLPAKSNGDTPYGGSWGDACLGLLVRAFPLWVIHLGTRWGGPWSSLTAERGYKTLWAGPCGYSLGRPAVRGRPSVRSGGSQLLWTLHVPSITLAATGCHWLAGWLSCYFGQTSGTANLGLNYFPLLMAALADSQWRTGFWLYLLFDRVAARHYLITDELTGGLLTDGWLLAGWRWRVGIRLTLVQIAAPVEMR
jgi:hypothetical protein